MRILSYDESNNRETFFPDGFYTVTVKKSVAVAISTGFEADFDDVFKVTYI